jgi:riboflavin synthase
MPAELARYVAKKGSVTVDGVSLTVNAVAGTVFEVNIIPHTAEVTIIGDYAVGSTVNIEVDLLARYLERLLSKDEHGVTMEFLKEHGYGG